jgi:hypothetical protein
MIHRKNVEIVVARYNENLAWLNEFPFNQFNYTVYNKGPNSDFEKTNVTKIVELPNVGRCDHTYLYHIIQNYHNLSNIIVFFPGSVNLPNKIDRAKKILLCIIKTNYKRAFFWGSYYNSLKITFKDFKLDHWASSCKENRILNPECQLKKCALRPYAKWYNYFFGNQSAHWVAFGGMFSIDKRDIIKHPLDRYISLINTVNNSSNPEAGHYIERSWGAIFHPFIFTIKVKI